MQDNALVWASAIAEFAATIGVINAAAIARGGALSKIEVAAMHGFLDILEGAAKTPDQKSVVQKYRDLLPADPDAS